MSTHLCDEQIRRLLSGTLPDEELVQAEAHLWSCSDCRDILRRHTEPTPDLPPLSVPGSTGAHPLNALPAVPGYEILGELGRGGMAVVYQARQLRPSRVVALKVLQTGLSADARRRFWAESEALARLQHPGIVQVYEAGEHDGRPYFSLEFCGGGSLARKLASDPMEPPQAAALVEAVARAVAAAHRAGIVHRDLKPANILLQREFTTESQRTQRRQKNVIKSKRRRQSTRILRLVHLLLFLLCVLCVSGVSILFQRSVTSDWPSCSAAAIPSQPGRGQSSARHPTWRPNSSMVPRVPPQTSMPLGRSSTNA
jgi:serine/threonine protein kinase